MEFFSDLLGTQFVGPVAHSDHEIAFDNSGIEMLAAQLDPHDTHGAWIELVEYDYIPPVALANMEKTDIASFFRN